MTAETLKPFITPQSVDFPAAHSTGTRRQRNNNLLVLGLGVTGIVATIILLGFTLWNSARITRLSRDYTTLNDRMEYLTKRLGIEYLDEISDFEKEYAKTLLDYPEEDGDDEEDDEEDERSLTDKEDNVDDLISEEYDESDVDADDDDDDDDDLTNKYKNYYDSLGEDETDDANKSNASEDDDDNLFDDFEKYNNSKKKKESERKARSIAPVSKILSVYEDAQENKSTGHEEMANNQNTHKPLTRTHSTGVDSRSHGNHKHHFVAEYSMDGKRRSPLRGQRGSRKRKIPIIRSGESLLSAKSSRLVTHPIPMIAAAHFHLNRKVPDRHAAINVDSYPGDMYIGHSSWQNEIDHELYFKVQNGVLTVREQGLYYIYAQICYNNTHDQNGFVIFHGNRPFLQCLNTVPTNMPHKIHTCHTSGLIFLKENETIHLRDFHTDRNVILKDTNNRSYFGIIKI